MAIGERQTDDFAVEAFGVVCVRDGNVGLVKVHGTLFEHRFDPDKGRAQSPGHADEIRSTPQRVRPWQKTALHNRGRVRVACTYLSSKNFLPLCLVPAPTSAKATAGKLPLPSTLALPERFRRFAHLGARDRFLALANAGYQAVFRVNSETQWLAVTDVTPKHDAAAEVTGKATPRSMAILPIVALYKPLTGVSDSRRQWFIFAAAFMISACTTGIMSAM
jgi:hypothetical protein